MSYIGPLILVLRTYTIKILHRQYRFLHLAEIESRYKLECEIKVQVELKLHLQIFSHYYWGNLYFVELKRPYHPNIRLRDLIINSID